MSVQPDPLVPVRDVGGVAQIADLGLQGHLRLRIAMDQEDLARIARLARVPAIWFGQPSGDSRRGGD
jgi:hypothetical protein